MKQAISVRGVLPYEPFGFTNCVRYDGVLYLSGISGLDADGNVVAADMETQTQKAFENISTILQAAGSNLDQILQMTSFVVDLDKHGAAYVAARRTTLKNTSYTSATIGVSALMMPGLLLEVQCCAAAR